MKMLIWFIRLIFIVLMTGVAAETANYYRLTYGTPEVEIYYWTFFVGIVGIGVLAIVVDEWYKNKRISVISSIFFGLLLGCTLGHYLSVSLQPLFDSSVKITPPAFKLMLTILLCYFSISILLQTKSDFRFIIPYVEFARQVKGNRPLIVDTSVIIDGRIAEIAETGIFGQTLVVPRFVLNELQGIADSNDKTRRSRGRLGLDVLDRIRNCAKVELEIHDEIVAPPRDKREADAKIIELSKQLDGKLLTNDINLAKTAKLHNVETVNINDISTASRPPVRRGETFTVALEREGEGEGQAIGYLDDGTMVVAESARAFVGRDVTLVVTSVLQTQAGRMVFGRMVDPNKPDDSTIGGPKPASTRR